MWIDHHTPFAVLIWAVDLSEPSTRLYYSGVKSTPPAAAAWKVNSISMARFRRDS